MGKRITCALDLFVSLVGEYRVDPRESPCWKRVSPPFRLFGLNRRIEIAKITFVVATPSTTLACECCGTQVYGRN